MKIQRIVLVLFFISFIFGNSLFVNTKSAAAVSENIVVYQLQTAGPTTGTASQELVLLYNNSLQEVNITEWCIKYTSSTDSSGFSKCLAKPDPVTELWLNAGGIISFATSEFIVANSGFVPDVVFSAGIAATPGGHMRVINNLGTEVDKVGWGSAINPESFASVAHTVGKVLSRDLNSLLIDSDNNLNDFSSQTVLSSISSGLYEKEIIVDVCPNIEDIQAELPVGYMQDESSDCYLDICPNIDGLQIEVEEQYYLDQDSGDCLLVPLEDSILFITELLPNAPSNDAGLEFVEIYNPNTEPIELAGYSLQIGPDFLEKFTFTSGEIGPGQYLVYSDTQTGLVLPNTTGVQLRLVAPAGNVVSSSSIYNGADDNVSWALVEDQWIYTNQITPNAANKPYLEPAQEEVIGVTSILAPCPAGKYRNPETNRCRTIETAVSILAPCDEDEYRNPETNRCRKAVSASQLTPCKAGQVRNPETNRCRATITTSALADCPEGQVRNPETNRCRKVNVLGATTESDLSTVQDVKTSNTKGSLNWTVIIATLGATLAYIIYEWRVEIRHKLYLIRNK